MYEPAPPPKTIFFSLLPPLSAKWIVIHPHLCWVTGVQANHEYLMLRHKRELNWIDTCPLSCHHARQKKHYKPKNKQKKHQNKNRKLHKNHKQKQKTSTAGGQLISSWTIGNEMITLYHLRDWYDNVKQEKQTAKCHTTIFFSVQRLHSFCQVV